LPGRKYVLVASRVLFVTSMMVESDHDRPKRRNAALVAPFQPCVCGTIEVHQQWWPNDVHQPAVAEGVLIAELPARIPDLRVPQGRAEIVRAA
jgi:hypothetical protein